MDIECSFCGAIVDVGIIDFHEEECQKSVVSGDISIENNIELSHKQKSAIKYVKKKSKIYSRQVKELLLGKLIDIDHINDFDILVNFVHSCDCIIHFRIDLLDKMIKDTKYRNQFETGTSGGALSRDARTDWEDNLFGGIYHNAADPERVKYGVLNINNDRHGVKTALAYGDCYFVLHDHVKDRISFVYGDSSAKQIHICTMRHMYHALYYLDNEHLKTMIATAKSGVQGYGMQYSYMEIQIHGDVRLKEDIKKIYIPVKYEATNKDTIEEFCMKFDIEYEYT